MKKFIITEEEKGRILGMHKTASSKHYLMESIHEGSKSLLNEQQTPYEPKQGDILLASNYPTNTGHNYYLKVSKSPSLTFTKPQNPNGYGTFTGDIYAVYNFNGGPYYVDPKKITDGTVYYKCGNVNKNGTITLNGDKTNFDQYYPTKNDIFDKTFTTQKICPGNTTTTGSTTSGGTATGTTTSGGR